RPGAVTLRSTDRAAPAGTLSLYRPSASVTALSFSASIDTVAPGRGSPSSRVVTRPLSTVVSCATAGIASVAARHDRASARRFVMETSGATWKHGNRPRIILSGDAADQDRRHRRPGLPRAARARAADAGRG